MGQTFHLIVDALLATGGPRPGSKGREEIEALEVPAGLSALTATGGRPCLAAAQSGAAAGAFVLEPVQHGQRPQLVLVSPPGRRARVNGQPAPPVAILGVKDQLQLNDDYILHVTLFNRPAVGPTPEAAVGQQCPLCRTPFSANTTVYICPACATPLHCEGADKGPDRLECVYLSAECPVCGAPVVLTQGYAYLPEVGSD